MNCFGRSILKYVQRFLFTIDNELTLLSNPLLSIKHRKLDSALHPTTSGKGLSRVIKAG